VLFAIRDNQNQIKNHIFLTLTPAKTNRKRKFGNLNNKNYAMC